jgi:two-component system response regulator YesN
MLYDIAIVDDEPAICRGLSKKIDWEGLGFHVAASFLDGEDVLEYLTHKDLVVILTDIRMSVVSGLDVAREVHNRDLKTEVVLLTGYKDFEYAREALRYGVRDYLLKPINLQEIKSVFTQIHQRLERGESKSIAHENRSSSLTEMADDNNTDVMNSQAIELVCLYIRSHIHDDLTLDNVAQEFYYSTAYFSRLFKQKTGKTFLTFLTECRMEKAELLLRDEPDLGISGIAKKVGYGDSNYFARVFKQYSGRTPSIYRRELRLTSGK